MPARCDVELIGTLPGGAAALGKKRTTVLQRNAVHDRHGERVAGPEVQALRASQVQKVATIETNGDLGIETVRHVLQ